MNLSEKTLHILSHPSRKNFMETLKCYHDEKDSAYYFMYEKEWALGFRHAKGLGALMITNEVEFFEILTGDTPPKEISIESGIKGIVKLYFEGKTTFPMTIFQMATLMGEVLPQEIVNYKENNPSPEDANACQGG